MEVEVCPYHALNEENVPLQGKKQNRYGGRIPGKPRFFSQLETLFSQVHKVVIISPVGDQIITSPSLLTEATNKPSG